MANKIEIIGSTRSSQEQTTKYGPKGEITTTKSVIAWDTNLTEKQMQDLAQQFHDEGKTHVYVQNEVMTAEKLAAIRNLWSRTSNTR